MGGADRTERNPPEPWAAAVWPSAPRGWWALVMAAIGLGSWVVLPLITTVFRETYPVTDTFLMPVIGLALVALAAVVDVLVVWLGGQRSAINLVAVILTSGATLFLGFFVIGEGLGGA